jgi:hypothetical protein
MIMIVDAGKLAKALKLVFPFASKDMTRLYMCAVRLEVDDQGQVLRVVATDAKAMAVVSIRIWEHDRAAGAVDLTLPCASALQAACKGASRVAFSEGQARVDDSLTMALVTRAEAFPPWKRVLPSEGGDWAPGPRAVDAALLARAGRALRDFAKPDSYEHGHVRVSWYEPLGATRWDVTNEDIGNLTVVVMPRRP